MTKEVESVEQKDQAPILTLETLVMAARIIAVASKRGVFEAAELSNVGRTFDELNAYIEFYAPKKEEPEAKE